ncbi:unnamed protein product [Rotaria magnacalcarata]|uniref:Uncharacterized protein n=1 Tax=Rotaria magnacalcarata TaxID=392030 RepID=A0A818ZU66_9BILA|nr:unnamed protein product [Rotaria magnacalcarata]CAF1658229.1 unnamed protein product [Rotaria magnacalcarata]CAF2069806.1 unnamed protein product [Rotaria magnacalcarata]CAF2082167.1 unnamed protein product [Rotaria magnacalcarata]CAF2181255.1 unnamed protein product [Rotaria magnacalcarata]
MFASLVFLVLPILPWETTKTIRLDYKYFKGQSLSYSDIQIVECRGVERQLDETIEYIQMNCTEQMIEIESIINIEKRSNSIRIFPFNRYKYKELSEISIKIFILMKIK